MSTANTRTTTLATNQHLAISLLLFLVGMLYWSMLLELWRVWHLNPNYSHGYVVGLVALALVVRQALRFGGPLQQEATTDDLVRGVIRVVGGLVLHLACQLMGSLLLPQVISLVLVLSGGLLVLGGRAGYRPYTFPIWFLVFAAPLPPVVYQQLSFQLQQLTSIATQTVLHAVSVPVVREGYRLRVPGSELEVGAACSGLSGVNAVVAFSLLVAHLTHASWRGTWLLALVSLPITVITNCLRATLAAVIILWFGRRWAEGVYHSLEGLLLILVPGTLVLMLASWLLERRADARSVSAADPQECG